MVWVSVESCARSDLTLRDSSLVECELYDVLLELPVMCVEYEIEFGLIETMF